MSAGEASKGTILVVDDEEMNIVVLSKILTRSGFQVISATNGFEGVEASKGEPKPNLILMDLMMPQMNGWDATKAIKAAPETKDIPVIAVTALTNEHQAAIDFGFDNFCPKPIDFNSLISIIEGFLKKSA